MKFMIHSKRIRLMPYDIDNALILNNIEVFMNKFSLI